MDVDSLFKQAVLQLNQSRFVQAEKICHDILDEQKEHIGALEILALSLLNQNKVILSDRIFHQLQKINPSKKYDYLLMQFKIAEKREEFELARKYSQALLETNIDPVNNYLRLGSIYQNEFKYDEAIVCYEKALKINNTSVDVYCRLGLAHKKRGDVLTALACYSDGLQLMPTNWILLRNKGNALFDLGRFDEAKSFYDKARLIRPNDPDVEFSYHQFLLLEKFTDSLPALDYRWDLAVAKNHYRPFKQAAWKGESLKGKSILLWGEQGLGDKLMLAGLFDLILDEAESITYEATVTVYELFKNSFPKINVVLGVNPISDKLFNTDYHAPIFDIVRWRIHSISDIKPRMGYLKPRDQDVVFYQNKLPKNKKLKIGLAWRGNKENFKNGLRTIPFELFEALLDLDFIELINLQFDITEEEKKTPLGKKLIDLTADIKNCQQSAALIKNCDCVVSIDSAPIHLAGAVNTKAFLLLPLVPCDWRWFLNRTDSVWYSSVTLIRQAEQSGWKNVIKKLIIKLTDWHNDSLGKKK